MLRRWIAPVAALALLALPGCGEEEHGVTAQSADRFVDSIGVNVHMSYDGTAYGRVGAVRSALRSLGVRHVRDGVVIGREDQYSALRALARDGVRSDLILGDPQGRFGTGTLDQQIATVTRRLDGVAETVEGPNEYDSSGDRDWPATLRRYQQRLFEAVRSEPSLTAVEVVGPSVIDTGAWSRVGDLSDVADYGNIHPYPGGEPPAAGPVEHQVDLVRASARQDPIFVTETGYHNALHASKEHQPAVSERAAAIYLVRLLLENFDIEIERTFIYELADVEPEPAGTDSGRHFGIVHNDFSPKPAFIALRNTIALLKDPGTAFQPGRLDFTLAAGEPVKSLLLGKRDGRFYLALWRPGAAAWSKAAKRDLDPAPVAVEVRFADTVRRARTYSPVASRGPIGSRDDLDSLRLQLGVEPLIVEVERG